jgi:diguanylate cyclase (GGDEF)-like protein
MPDGASPNLPAADDDPVRYGWTNPLGWRRTLALGVLLAAVAAVAYLEKAVAGTFDLTLLYFSIVLTAGLLLPRAVALPIVAAVGIVDAGITVSDGLSTYVNAGARMLVYIYAAILTSSWEQERRRLKRISQVDELTGLYNLRALRDQLPIWLGPAARAGRSMAVLMLDLDGFKAVNDRLGHHAGNEILRRAADVLRVCVRIGDPVYRFGGDEFVVLLADTGAEGAEVVAQRVQQALHQLRPTFAGEPMTISFSAGVALYPADGETPEILLSRADEALYRAKGTGHGAIVRWHVPEGKSQAA